MRNGYTRIAERVLATRRAIQRGAEALGCPAYGDPQLSILAYGTPGLDTPAVASGLTRRGWLVGQTREPPGIQLMLNLTHEPVVAEYLADLEEALAEARAGTTEGGPEAVYA